ncbi:MAG TPA: 2-(1,2-epoxy-1,2-dihydrophenyl)acetyl-CoA isomerase, partial [Anaerolineae bacterium]|nr:2-(1,2-epoxy-1,2-dihydrophenyl)acetyl-CoA isomerase [Anaerolineae bacterium]
LNALTTQMSKAMLAALKTCARDDHIRCVVITGAGRGFSAGQDLTELAHTPDGWTVGDHLRHGYNRLILAMHDLEKPIIAAVNGVAAGAGLGVALAADMRIASEKASFVPAFISIGLAPDSGVSWHLQRLAGPARAFELLATGRKVKAEEALTMGLVNQVVPAEALEESVNALARQLAQGPTRGIGLTKRALNRAATVSLAEALDYEAQMQDIAIRTQDHREGVQAFLEKRPPQFTGA